MCVSVCVCARVRARHALKLTSKIHFELQTHPNDQIHTKHVKTTGLESIHLKQFISQSEREQLGENCQYFVLVTDWCFNNVNQRTKHKEKITLSS